MSSRWTCFLGGVVLAAWALRAGADPSPDAPGGPDSFAPLVAEYDRTIRPLLQARCYGCHSTRKKKGRLDLEQFATLDDARREPGVWRKAIEQLEADEMPPEGKPPLDPAERGRIIDWARRLLRAESLANAGDPGEVVLRRLSRAEYTRTVRDLTGLDLDPTRDFPADGAAGEGFTNAGEALVMSPALFEKYLHAAKRVADHAVLVPAGFRFSKGATARDRTEEILREIRGIYSRHSSADGRADTTRYLAACIRHRPRLLDDPESAAAIAEEEGLSADYLRSLAVMLVSGEPASALLDRVRAGWRSARVEDAASIAGEIRVWQDALWTFRPVGHFGLVRPWQAPVDPLPEAVALRRKLAPETGAPGLVIYLVAGDGGDGAAGDLVVWQRPRLEIEGGPTVLLRDVRPMAARIERELETDLGRASCYLMAAAGARSSGRAVEELAKAAGLDPRLLRAWMEYLGLSMHEDRRISGHLRGKLVNVAGYEAIDGWGSEATPNLLANASDQPIAFLTLAVPARGVTVHPSPSHHAAIAWQSPIAGRVTVRGDLTDADGVCGNGAAWRVELVSASGVATVASGAFGNGGGGGFEPPEPLDVIAGDHLSVVVAARDRDHACDTTAVHLRVAEEGGAGRLWDLARDIAETVHAGNPHGDSYGNPSVWHFLAGEEGAERESEGVPPGSALARWKEALASGRPPGELEILARAVEESLGSAAARSGADEAMVRQLCAWNGPLQWLARIVEEPLGESDGTTLAGEGYGIAPSRFGKHPRGGVVPPDSIAVEAPSLLAIRLPAALASGAEFAVEGKLDDGTGGEGSVELEILDEPPPELSSSGWRAGVPVVTRPGSSARARVADSYADFRSFFPAAMCYPGIVPVDEVVTLVLFHREDEHLRRLMLGPGESARLERLWDDLRFVSEEPLKLVAAYEQITEYATQDRPDLVEAFKPLRELVYSRAVEFKRSVSEAEASQLDALLAFADRAYRCPLNGDAAAALITLYRGLRDGGRSHADALRATLARVLVAPSFLYKVELPAAGREALPVSDVELASRLSYFLWSSMPDATLRRAADSGQLHEPERLWAEARRMLRDGRTGALAVEFAAQWLGVYGFDLHDEKNEALFPEFAGIRGPMYEEVVRFFEDLIRRDGSLLEVLDADHTFLNGPLAQHYGAGGVSGPEWRRVEGMRAYGRGGILGMGAILSKHSGASRTSPVLRGNWVVETLLGEKLPRPPPEVPDLARSEGVDELSVRELTERHREAKECASCHDRIDPFGFALEAFDSIGRYREEDGAGRAIDTRAVLKSGEAFEGLSGLREYLLTARRADFLRQLSRKLLGYALGRAVEVSDEALLDEMLTALEEDGGRFSAAIRTIVLSRQFRYQRGRDAAEELDR